MQPHTCGYVAHVFRKHPHPTPFITPRKFVLLLGTATLSATTVPTFSVLFSTVFSGSMSSSSCIPSLHTFSTSAMRIQFSHHLPRSSIILAFFSRKCFHFRTQICTPRENLSFTFFPPPTHLFSRRITMRTAIVFGGER